MNQPTDGNSRVGEGGDVRFERLKLRDWTFSDTAEAVVGALLLAVIVVTLFALA